MKSILEILKIAGGIAILLVLVIGLYFLFSFFSATLPPLQPAAALPEPGTEGIGILSISRPSYSSDGQKILVTATAARDARSISIGRLNASVVQDELGIQLRNDIEFTLSFDDMTCDNYLDETPYEVYRNYYQYQACGIVGSGTSIYSSIEPTRYVAQAESGALVGSSPPLGGTPGIGTGSGCAPAPYDFGEIYPAGIVYRIGGYDYGTNVRVVVTSEGVERTMTFNEVMRTASLPDGTRASFEGSLLGTQSCTSYVQQPVAFIPRTGGDIQLKSLPSFLALDNQWQDISYSMDDLVSRLATYDLRWSTFINSVGTFGDRCLDVVVSAGASLTEATISCRPLSPAAIPVLTIEIPVSSLDIVEVVVPEGEIEITSCSTVETEALDVGYVTCTYVNTGLETDAFDFSLEVPSGQSIAPIRDQANSGQTKTIQIPYAFSGIAQTGTVEGHSVNHPENSDSYEVRIVSYPVCTTPSPSEGHTKVYASYGCVWVCENQYETDLFPSNCAPITNYDRCLEYGEIIGEDTLIPTCGFGFTLRDNQCFRDQTINFLAASEETCQDIGGTWHFVEGACQQIINPSTRYVAAGGSCNELATYGGLQHCTGIGTYTYIDSYLDAVNRGELLPYIPIQKENMIHLGPPTCDYVPAFGYHLVGGELLPIDDFIFDYSVVGTEPEGILREYTNRDIGDTTTIVPSDTPPPPITVELEEPSPPSIPIPTGSAVAGLVLTVVLGAVILVIIGGAIYLIKFRKK